MSTGQSPALAAILTALLWAIGPAVQADSRTRLVADIQQAEAEDTSSESSDFVVFDGAFYFAAIDELHGEELWRSDGTAAGTWRVKDICAGPSSSKPFRIMVLDGTLYFFAISKPEWRFGGSELWKSDGTAEGTVPVRRVCYSGCHHRSLSEMTVFDGALYFSGHDPAHGRELWTSDGTTAGTVLLSDICTGSCSSFPHHLEGWGDHLYFEAENMSEGSELWRTDGSPAGTELHVDLCAGECSSSPAHLKALYPDLFIFKADDGVLGSQAWAIDGSGELFPFQDLMPGDQRASPRTFVRRGDEYYFLASGADLDPKTWKTDGTAEGTVPAPALQPLGNPYRPWDILVAGDTIFFTMLAGFPQAELWASDGTVEGTRLLASETDRVILVGALGEKLIFGLEYDGQTGDLGISDGTLDGTHLMPGVKPAFLHGFSILAVHDGQALFAADTGSGYQPWVSDGTRKGTRLVRRIRGSVGSSNPQSFTSLGQTLVFQANDGVRRQLWASDGSEAGTRLIEPVLVPRAEPVKAGDRLFFAADLDELYPAYQALLWTTDAPFEGAQELITPRGVRQMTAHGGELYFSVRRPGQRVWRSDGTDDGTFEVKDVNPLWDPCPFFLCPLGPVLPPDRMTSAGDLVYFVAWDEDHDSQLWVSDGNADGTVPVAAFTSFPESLTGFGSKLLFTLDSAETGRELWSSDGTPEGTALVADLTPGPASSTIRVMTPAAEQLYFVLRGEDAKDHLWRTDGTAAGTWRVSDLTVDGAGSEVSEIVVAGNRLFLAVDHPSTGDELWTSDGTAEGTVLVADIQPGPAGSTPRSLTVVEGRLLFAADDGARGGELWTSDATTEGTYRVADLLPGIDASGPSGFTRIGPWIYFAASRPDVGRELFAVHVRSLFRRGHLSGLSAAKR